MNVRELIAELVSMDDSTIDVVIATESGNTDIYSVNLVANRGQRNIVLEPRDDLMTTEEAERTYSND